MNGPWHTLDDACEILKLRRGELVDQIEKGNIRAAAYTAIRPMLLTSRNSDGNWIGRASCRYRGYLLMHPRTIAPLLHGESVSTGSASFTLLDPSGVTGWNAANPFQSPLPLWPLMAWESLKENTQKISDLFAFPFPYEGFPVAQMLQNLGNALKSNTGMTQDTLGQLLPAVMREEDKRLNFNQNDRFEPSCICVADSEIQRYLSKRRSTPTPPEPVDGRENQLHTLFTRIIRDNPNVSAKEAWRLIEQDYFSDDPVYDIDSIIEQIGPNEIEWKSRHGNNQNFRYSSLSSTRDCKLNCVTAHAPVLCTGGYHEQNNGQ